MLEVGAPKLLLGSQVVKTIVCGAPEASSSASTAKMRRAKLGAAFGLLLREHRQALGLSQEDVAGKAGVHPTHVGLVERGQRTPSLDVAAGLAQAVGLSLSDLVREAEQRVRRE